MPTINLYDSQPHLGSPFDGAEEAARGGRYLAVAIVVGLFVWLGMAVALAAWTM